MTQRWIPRFRFSLRTLLFLVLLIASGATLWWNWGPWEVAYVVDEPRPIILSKYSDDDRYVMFSYTVPFENGQTGWNNYLDIREAATGESYALLKTESSLLFELKGDYVLFFLENKFGEKSLKARRRHCSIG